MMDPASDDAAAEAEMSKYGITRTLVAHYQFKDYRYARLEDAVAQAQRHERLARQQ